MYPICELGCLNPIPQREGLLGTKTRGRTKEHIAKCETISTLSLLTLHIDDYRKGLLGDPEHESGALPGGEELLQPAHLVVEPAVPPLHVVLEVVQQPRQGREGRKRKGVRIGEGSWDAPKETTRVSVWIYKVASFNVFKS
jgi:hypothetical protein